MIKRVCDICGQKAMGGNFMLPALQDKIIAEHYDLCEVCARQIVRKWWNMSVKKSNMTCDICKSKKAVDCYELPRYTWQQGIVKEHYQLCEACARAIDNTITDMEVVRNFRLMKDCEHHLGLNIIGY